MVFHLTDRDVLEVCGQCPSHQDGICRQHEEQEVLAIKRCPEWNTFYGGRCFRK